MEQHQAIVGGFVKVRITTESHLDALAIPKLALIEEGGLRSVFVAEADSVRKVEIRTGLYDESHVEVLDGVNEGDFIVTLGQGSLRNGSLIEPLNADDIGWRSKNTEGSLVTDETESTVALTPSN
jgi:multidrug efflux pump subunit AcrA (membrane-fusion protein)